MHELAIANSIVDTVLDEAARRNLKAITAVGLRVGDLTDIVPEALEFGFSAIISNTPLQGVRLEIERVPLGGTCRACSESFDIKEMVFACPRCGSGKIKIDRGEELDIAYIEVGDD
ncbi:MAG: hydrogenase maturation nickel metallochaperone HypA [Candidatus Zixiibacteriota bacterium]|nr:MAG: hydrogenase maturation nickel metallochaperone HypA [candidate division Zixibacteria bacterium]